MKNLVDSINEAKRKEEEVSKVFFIQKEVENFPVIFSFHFFFFQKHLVSFY